MRMTKETALRALEKGHLWDMGQLSPEALRELDRMVRNGRATRERARWPLIDSGTCTKTLYRPNGRGGEE